MELGLELARGSEALTGELHTTHTRTRTHVHTTHVHAHPLPPSPPPPPHTSRYGGGTDAEKDAKYKTYFEGDPDTNVEAVAPKWFAFYETMLVRSKTPFLGGSGDVSMADFLLYDLLDNHEGQQPDRTRALLGVSRFPALVAWRARIASRPNIAAYLASPNRRKR